MPFAARGTARLVITLFAAVSLLLPTPASADDDSATASTSPTAAVIIAVGAEGTPEYSEQFRAWAARWEAAAAQGGAATVTIGNEGDGAGDADREMFRQSLADHAAVRDVPLWIVFIGHGTFDGRSAKFNLRGDDVSSQDLAGWLAPLERPVAVINCSSASFPFLKDLSAPARVIVTATKSGFEANFSRFGEYLSQAIGDVTADLDKDEQVSLLEAFLRASRRTREFYEGENRLATEHALLDDDGDGLGTRGEAFSGIRPVRDSETGALDGYRAHQWRLIPSDSDRLLSPEQRVRRDELEVAVFELRDRKAEMEEGEYFAALERLLVELAQLYEAAGNPAPAAENSPTTP